MALQTVPLILPSESSEWKSQFTKKKNEVLVSGFHFNS